MKGRPETPAGLRKQLLAMARVLPPQSGDVIIATLGRFPTKSDERNPRLESFPEKLPPFLTPSAASQLLRYTTADIRKMWPVLMRTFGLQDQRPRGDEVNDFQLWLLSVPFGGAAFLQCAIESKTARSILLNRDEAGIRMPKALLPTLAARGGHAWEQGIATSLVLNAWIFGEMPHRAQYEEIRTDAERHALLDPDEHYEGKGELLTQAFEYLDWLRTLDPQPEALEEPSVEEAVMPRTTTAHPRDVSKIYEEIAEKIMRTASKAEIYRAAEDALHLEEGIRHLRAVAAYAHASKGQIPAAVLNPLLNEVQFRIGESNQATRPQFTIEPLPVSEIPRGAPYLCGELKTALQVAVKAGAEVPPRIDEFSAARARVLADGGMASDDDLECMRRARRALLDTAGRFGADVDGCRSFFNLASVMPPVIPASEEIRAAYAAAMEYLHASDAPNETSIPPTAPFTFSAIPDATAPSAGEPAVEPRPMAARIELALPSSIQPAPIGEPVPVAACVTPEAVSAPATPPAPVEIMPAPVMHEPAWAAQEPTVTVTPGTATDPVGQTIEADPAESNTLRSLSHLLLNGNPGLALALARIHEEALLEELSGGPAFYALLCGAAATCGIDVPRYDGLDRHFDGVMQRLQSTGDAEMGQAYSMAYLAAIAKPALMTSNAQAAYNIHLISDSLGIPALVSLAPMFEEPMRHNLPTSLEALRDSSGKGEDARKASVAQARVRARQIIDNIEVRHDFNSHAISQSTWRHLRSPQHPIGAALHALSNGVRDDALETKLRTAVALVEDGYDDVVDEAFAQYSRTKLVGTNRLRLCTAIERISEFLEQTLRLVQPSKLQGDEAARLANYTGRLVSGISSSIEALTGVRYEGAREIARGVLEMVLRDLNAMVTEAGTPRRTMGIDECLLRDLSLWNADLGVEINGAGNDGKTLYAVGQEVVIHGDRSDLLNNLRLCSSKAPTDQAFIDAARMHIDARRILSANYAVTALRAQAPDYPELASLISGYEAARAEARLMLREHALTARKALARAAFSSLLAPAEIVRKEAAIDAVLDLAKNLPIEGPISGPLTNDRPTDFISARQFLDVMIVEPLAQMQRKAVEAFEAKVGAERSQIAERLQPSVEKVLQLARDGQIVSAEEFWTQLQKDQDLPRLATGSSLLREFHEQYLPAAAKQEKAKTPPATEFSKEDLQAQRQLLDAWTLVSQAGQAGASRTLVQFLSTLVKTDVATVGSPQILGNVGLYEVAGLDIARAVGPETFVLPVIGSSSKSRFRVAVVHGPGSLTTIREALSHGPNVLLTRARLTLDDRRRLYIDVRKESRGCLIIDDHLIHFAASVPSSAAARVVAVASSFLYTEPYKVEDATTPEMYFGRRAARRQIFEARTALIFGGRRLGKSSIIADICRRETSVAQKKFYVHVELSQFMEAEKYEEEVWRRIAQALLATGAVSNTTIQFNVGNHKAVLDTLKKSFADDKITHLTLYLDEADRFMKLEESTNFRVLYELSTELTQRYPDRFSYAISGLNNVQRISLGWNTRLGRIGDPIAITPFIDDDRYEGLRLIVEPLAALGFEFESPDLPLQILSAASFYPALIQGYCSKLLELLYKKPIDGVAPFMITQNDLATTEATEDLRRKFLDIFKLTVLLDNRYMVVCAILAEEQEFREGADVSMLLSAISERAVQIAPDMFPKSDPTTIVEAAAESLINLGLLVRQPHTQHYQFRSPRILSKVREISQVADFLKGAGNRQQFLDHDPAEHRPLFSDRTICPLPERLVNSVCAPSMPGESTRFITGSEASGLSRLRKLGQDPTWAAKRVNVRSGHAESEQLLKDLIGQIAKVRDGAKQKLTLSRGPQERELVVVGGNWLPSAPDRIAQVDAALQAEHRSVLLVCDSDRAWDLAALPGTRMTYLPHWTPSALRLHLQSIEMPDFTGAEPLGRIIDVTGGCTALIEAACQWLASRRAIPSTMDLLQMLKVGDVKGLYALFGLRAEHESILNDMPAKPQTRAILEQLFKEKGVDAARLFNYLEWMGALQVDENGRWNLNSVITTALLELM